MTWTVKFPGNINITNNVYDVIIVGSINIVNLPVCGRLLWFSTGIHEIFLEVHRKVMTIKVSTVAF